MSTEKKKIPPIQPAPVRPFTIRLVDGHFVRVPKLDQTAQTDSTRPASVPLASSGDLRFPRTMRLIDGRFVRVTDLAADATDAPLPSDAKPAARVRPEPARAPRPAAPPGKVEAAKDSWASAFETGIHPSDLTPEP